MKKLGKKSGAIALSMLLMARAVFAQTPAALPPSSNPVPQAAPAVQAAPATISSAPVSGALTTSTPISEVFDSGIVEGERQPFQSDHAFDGFASPVSAPILAKDPRSLTEIRGLFIYDRFDSQSIVGPGNFQVYAAQARVALTERLTFIADSDGLATIHSKALGTNTGFLNLGAGLKYVFVRDVENQFIWSGGAMYMIPSGEANVLSGTAYGNGSFTFFTTAGKELCDHRTHIIGNLAFQQPVNTNQNSTFMFSQIHIDRQYGKIYPLAELNWYHYFAGGQNVPAGVQEGDGLINIGTKGVAGNDLVTTALGARYMFSQSVQLGAAWEFPVTGQHELLNNRLTVDLILRY